MNLVMCLIQVLRMALHKLYQVEFGLFLQCLYVGSLLQLKVSLASSDTIENLVYSLLKSVMQGQFHMA